MNFMRLLLLDCGAAAAPSWVSRMAERIFDIGEWVWRFRLGYGDETLRLAGLTLTGEMA
jgi:hypothetical protein